jgi:hypothetical protein
MAESIRERMTANPTSLECGSTVMEAARDPLQERGGRRREVVEGIST